MEIDIRQFKTLDRQFEKAFPFTLKPVSPALRKKKNRSGTTSVVVVDKSRGDFKELKTIGLAMTVPR